VNEMEIEKTVKMSFADFVEQVAAKAGLKVEKRNPSLIVVPYNMGGDRHQSVYVRPLGMTANKSLIIGFSSPALKMPAGQQLGQKTANDLLRENAKLPHGAWAIESIEDAEYLVAFDTQIAQTMDPIEFKASAGALADIADSMEQKLGTDNF